MSGLLVNIYTDEMGISREASAYRLSLICISHFGDLYVNRNGYGRTKLFQMGAFTKYKWNWIILMSFSIDLSPNFVRRSQIKTKFFNADGYCGTMPRTFFVNAHTKWKWINLVWSRAYSPTHVQLIELQGWKGGNTLLRNVFNHLQDHTAS
jgi:hypothetical protein